MAQEVTKKAVITGIGIQTKGLLDRMSEEAAMERAAAAGFTCIDYNLNALLPEKTIREKTASLPGDTFFSLGEKEREDRLRPLKQAAHARGIRISQVRNRAGSLSDARVFQAARIASCSASAMSSSERR